MTLGPKWGRGHLPQDGPTPRTSWYYIVSDESQKRWPMYYNVVALHTHTHAQGGRPRPQSDKHQQNHAAAFEHKKNELSAAVVAGEMLNKYLGVYKQPYNSATCDWRAVRVGGNRLNNSEPFKSQRCSLRDFTCCSYGHLHKTLPPKTHDHRLQRGATVSHRTRRERNVCTNPIGVYWGRHKLCSTVRGVRLVRAWRVDRITVTVEVVLCNRWLRRTVEASCRKAISARETGAWSWSIPVD